MKSFLPIFLIILVSAVLSSNLKKAKSEEKNWISTGYGGYDSPKYIPKKIYIPKKKIIYNPGYGSYGGYSLVEKKNKAPYGGYSSYNPGYGSYGSYGGYGGYSLVEKKNEAPYGGYSSYNPGYGSYGSYGGYSLAEEKARPWGYGSYGGYGGYGGYSLVEEKNKIPYGGYGSYGSYGGYGGYGGYQ
jgi:hypothetical protein